jgi:hypothetical protein
MASSGGVGVEQSTRDSKSRVWIFAAAGTGRKKAKKGFSESLFFKKINSLSFFSSKHFERELLKRSILKGLLGIFLYKIYQFLPEKPKLSNRWRILVYTSCLRLRQLIIKVNRLGIFANWANLENPLGFFLTNKPKNGDIFGWFYWSNFLHFS